MNQILGELGKSQKFKELLNQIENKQSPIAISGLNDVGAVQIETAINQFGKKPICIITYNEIQAKKIYENVKYFTENVVLFPKKEIVTYDYIAESKDLPYRRIETLNEIQSKRNLIVVTTIEAIMQKLPAKDKLYKNELKFKIGDSFNLDKLKQKLVELGYTRCELIEGRGQFSIRGGIVDISISYKTGIRIEFWGDEIDSIRDFNISTQRSINTKENVIIYPAHEYVLEKGIEEICDKIKKDNANKEIIEEDIEQIKAGNYISKIDKYFDSFYEKAEPYIREVITKDLDLKKIAAMVKTRIEVFPDIKEHIDFFEALPEYDVAMYTHKKMKTNAQTSLEVLQEILPVLEAQEDYSNDALYQTLLKYVEQKGCKNGYVMWPIRTAVSGKQMTPGGATELMEVLGKEESIARIKKGIELLEQ